MPRPTSKVAPPAKARQLQGRLVAGIVLIGIAYLGTYAWQALQAAQAVSSTFH
jgi:cytochrome c-type biogenesis protein CcmH/NrfG